jgi:hypothetical protein
MLLSCDGYRGRRAPAYNKQPIEERTACLGYLYVLVLTPKQRYSY